MDGSKNIISSKTHMLVRTPDGAIAKAENGVLLFNKAANSIVSVPVTNAIRQMFGIGDVNSSPLDQSQTDIENNCDQDGYLNNTLEREVDADNENVIQGCLTELLIEEISKRPPLYNERLPLAERSRSIKKALELEIYHALKGQIALDAIGKKWTYLKKEYRKQKSIMNKYVRSGCSYEEAATICGKPLWKHFEALKFIDDIDDDRPTVSNVVPEYVSDGCSSSAGSSLSSMETLPGPSCGRAPNIKTLSDSSKKRKGEKIKEIDSVDQMLLEELSKTKLDSTDHFCQMLALEMKKIDSRARAKLQIKYLELLHDALSDAGCG